MYRNLVKILIVIFISIYSVVEAKDNCQPEFNLAKPSLNINTSDKEEDKKYTFVYFDQSLSMQGYTKDQPGQKNLYTNVIDDLQQLAENVGEKTFYHSFGKKIVPIKENKISQVITPSFYECSGSSTDCNNQESKIHLPFKMAKANPQGTYIIVTDLFLSSKQLVGGTLSQLTKPLKSILKKGKSVGIIGVMSSFNGTIYDIPTRNGGTVSYTEAQKRPFYIIIIGDQKEINQVKKNLEEQHFNDAEDKYKYTLITSTPILQNLNQKELITENNIQKISRAENFKFEYTKDNLAIYQFDTNKKNKYKFKVLNSEIIVPGSTGVSNFTIKERLWSSKKIKCKKINEGDWREAKLEDISSISQNENELTLNLFKNRPFAKLFRGFRYFYLAEVYAEKPGNLSEQTFEDWSIRDSSAEEFKEGNPVEFKTLNLTKIIKILSNVANDEFQPTLVASIALNFNLLK